MKTYVLNATLINPMSRTAGVNVIIDDGRILEITTTAIRPEKGSVQIDATCLYLCPGLIDIHFHGAVGKDTMDGDLQSLQILSNYCAEHGVTSFYPTTWAASPDDILLAINNVRENKANLGGAQAMGVHIEGPYINVKHRGAQLQSMIRNPIKEEFLQWFDSGVVKLITCAPEIPGGMDFVEEAISRDIRISIGHSGATYDQVIEAANLGATQATHLFNGMQGLNHREPATVGGLLADERIYPQVICDGVHVHQAVVKIIINAKAVSKVILITDSIRGAGLPDGDYDHKGQKFTVKDSIARTPEGGLSGSTLSLDAAVRNAMRFTEKSIEEIIPMVTSVPAQAMGISRKKGNIEQGYDADLVLVNQAFHVQKTLVNGKIVYERK
jgi:N-acetylglucosamine-6-phosphate deacetylase